jgi:hypothetical protein
VNPLSAHRAAMLAGTGNGTDPDTLSGGSVDGTTNGDTHSGPKSGTSDEVLSEPGNRADDQIIDLEQLAEIAKHATVSRVAFDTLTGQAARYLEHADRLTATAQRASEHRKAKAARRRATQVADWLSDATHQRRTP